MPLISGCSDWGYNPWRNYQTATTGSCNYWYVNSNHQTATSTWISYLPSSREARWIYAGVAPEDLYIDSPLSWVEPAANVIVPPPPDPPPIANPRLLPIERANRMLLSVLTEEQRQRYEESKDFVVVAHSGRRYLFTHGLQGNVFLLDANARCVERFCIHADNIPIPDNLIAQKFMLETDEAQFLRIANRSIRGLRPELGWVPAPPALAA